jgi:hypothetical protein
VGVNRDVTVSREKNALSQSARWAGRVLLSQWMYTHLVTWLLYTHLVTWLTFYFDLLSHMPVWQNPIDFTTQLWAITFAFLFVQQILIDFRFLPPSSILQRTIIFILQIGCNSSSFMPIPRVVMALFGVF